MIIEKNTTIVHLGPFAILMEEHKLAVGRWIGFETSVSKMWVHESVEHNIQKYIDDEENSDDLGDVDIIADSGVSNLFAFKSVDGSEIIALDIIKKPRRGEEEE